jgi:hypothetical protein
MAATYDGLLVSLTAWIIILILCTIGVNGAQPIPIDLGVAGVAMLIISVVACAREAGRYVLYQMEELVATVAAKRGQDLG